LRERKREREGEREGHTHRDRERQRQRDDGNFKGMTGASAPFSFSSHDILELQNPLRT
jgi:hypothetical protein